MRTNPERHRALAGLPQRYFLTIARFIPCKNLPFLVEAYARYRAAAGPGAHDLVLCGDGPERDRIERGRAPAAVDGVHLRGWLPQDALAPCYALASGLDPAERGVRVLGPGRQRGDGVRAARAGQPRVRLRGGPRA